ncbi:MAG TPA: DPP IV N-terminal domain-containing protein [Chthoniobacterales bacterium]|nr:DPP IV N-terminal domain-containing protein [Chthoniobacterales bacterium]
MTPPVLPADWTATQGVNVTAAPFWVTSPITPDTPPNDVFSSAPDNILDNRLDAPPIFASLWDNSVTFRHSYDLEEGFDGAVLEISTPTINGGAFTDVTDPAVGGTFGLGGGYNSTISTSTQSPIAGRMAWSGNSGGYVTVILYLGFIDQNFFDNVVLRFRLATDNSGASAGWRVDTFRWHHNECNPPLPTPTVAPTPTPTPTPTASPIPTPTPTPEASPTPTPAPGGNGKIAYTNHYFGYHIYVMNSQGYNRTCLTCSQAGDDSDPAWSPDGTKIAYTLDLYQNRDIYVMEADGSNKTNLTNQPDEEEADPTWSPDGARIAYTKYESVTIGEIFVMNADGSNQINLTNHPASDVGASWSPDGSKIAFTSKRDGQAEIYVMNADGSNPTRLTHEPSTESSPAWSPDGARIVFSSDRQGLSQIYVMNADGSNQVGLTSSTYMAAYSPDWSPDGMKIVFVRQYFEYSRIFIRDVDGSNGEEIIYDIHAHEPDWQRVAGPVPTPSPAQALNMSTRMRVETDDNVAISGFIITGDAPKSVALRGLGPSMTVSGELLADPLLELRGNDGGLIRQNNDWQDDPFQAAQLTALGLAPDHPAEAGIVATLQPGTYTAIVAGTNQTAGLALAEIYDVNSTADSQLANISTRGIVREGNNRIIGGFILVGETRTDVVVRGIGPSLAQFGLSPVLANPTLRLVDENGSTIQSNDDWQDDPSDAAILNLLGLGLQDPRESGIFVSLPPGFYTAILFGVDNGIGLGAVEIYNLQ